MPEPISPSRIHVRPRLRSAGSALVAPALLAIGALALLARAFNQLLPLLRYPYPNDGLEGTLLYEARLFWSGAALYQPLERFRFVSAPYPPLHPLLLGLADQLAGPHVFWSGRLISLVAALGVAALLVLMSRSVGGSWLGGPIGAALFLSTPPVLLWATRIKPDLLALFWTAVGLFFAQRWFDAGWGQEPRTKGGCAIVLRLSAIGYRLYAAAVCFVLAFFTKQTAVAAPLAVGLALLLADVQAFPGFRAPLPERAGRGYIGRLPVRWPTLGFGISYAGLALAIWALLDAGTGFQYSAHVWGLHRSEWWSARLLGKFVELLRPYWPAMLLALALAFRAARDRRWLVPACYALVVPISLLGAGETGANHNHLLECLLALSLVAGCTAGWMAALLRDRGTSWLLPIALLILLAGQLALAARPQQWYLGELAPADPPERYLALLRATPGEVLADDVGLLVAAGRPLRYDDPSTMGPASRSGVWDQSGLLEEIAGRRFGVILLPVDVETQTEDSAGRWTAEMLNAVRTHYRLAYRDTIFTYVPK
jgi:hypothetical protein